MQIGSGQSPLSVAVLKALGVQAPAVSAATATPAPQSAGAPSAARPDAAPPDLGVSKNIPRGSFVDFKA